MPDSCVLVQTVQAMQVLLIPDLKVEHRLITLLQFRSVKVDASHSSKVFKYFHSFPFFYTLLLWTESVNPLQRIQQLLVSFSADVE